MAFSFIVEATELDRSRCEIGNDPPPCVSNPVSRHVFSQGD